MKEYQLTPITETAVQATQAKGQKGKIAKQIVLGIDAHLHSYQVCRKIDAGGLQPVQSFGLTELLLFACKQLQLAEKVYAVYEAGPLGYVLYRKLIELGVEARVFAPESLEAGSKRKNNKIDARNWPGGFIPIWVGISTPYGLYGYPIPNRSNCGHAVANTINWCVRAKPLKHRGVA